MHRLGTVSKEIIGDLNWLNGSNLTLNSDMDQKHRYFRLRAKKGPAPPPLGNFADIAYLKENFKPHLLRDVCTLCSGALVSDSLLHMLL